MGWLILDNIDGKQARRTNTSSALGLLFDHQVDALNVTITTSYFANILMAPQYALTYWFIGALPFYFTTWEETYTGSLNFPFISAASDGCLFFGLLAFVFYWMQPETFIHQSFLGYEYRVIIMGVMIFVSCAVAIYK
jgi:ethanolaminephosphotransferase